MPCIAPRLPTDFSDAESDIRAHMNALKGSLQELRDMIENRGPDYVERFQSFLKIILEDLSVVQSNLDEYEEYQDTLPEPCRHGPQCQRLITELETVMTELHTELNRAESYL